MHILAATDFSIRSDRAVRQAGLLAQRRNSELHILHVVDDDKPMGLVEREKREAERLLNEQINVMPELRGTKAQSLVVAGDPFDAILRTAAEMGADLIVMGSHRKKLLFDIFVGTTIERVIRKGSLPVLMVNFEAQRSYERVVAAVDMTETSANALRVALATGLIGDKGATLLHAHVPMGRSKLFVAAPDEATIKSYLESERQSARDKLAAFLVANKLQHAQWSLRVDEGEPMECISRSVSEMQPDLLVMGTHGRSAIVKALIGSITEEALRTLNVDILAVPPTGR